MSASTAIGMVDESLRELLQEEMALVPAVNVTLLAPDETGPNRRVNLFLYKVVENEFLKNKDWEVARNDATRIVPPPLNLNLFYLMTAYAQNDAENGNASAHELLGDAMRVFHEHPIVPEAYLASGLLDARERLKITLHRPDIDELSKIWSTFGEPYRLSALYEVSVVQIDVSPEQTQTMAPRVQSIGAPQITPAMRLPSVDAMQPTSGPAGTTVTFTGSHLADRRAVVRVAGTVAFDDAIAGDSFDVALPAALAPGFHRVQVDVSRLFRRSFYFEVTP